jgi:response regulator of citrate/malate metabolism
MASKLRKGRAAGLSDLAALQILREPEIDPKRKTNQADWDKISEMLGGLRQEIPENAFCLDDYAQQFNLPRSTAVGDLEKLVKQGKLETMIHYSADARRSRRWWWLKPTAKKG